MIDKCTIVKEKPSWQAEPTFNSEFVLPNNTNFIDYSNACTSIKFYGKNSRNLNISKNLTVTIFTISDKAVRAIGLEDLDNENKFVLKISGLDG